MAIKDPNVLNKINTLNTNLEDADVARVEENISNRLFNVLEWSNSISVDSELYASINSVAESSNITTYINTAKTSLPNTSISIPYTWWAFNVLNSVVTLAAGAPIADTENAITNMNNAIAGLDTLPSQLNTLRSRLEENRRILNEIHNIQLDWRWTGRIVRDINNDITTETSNRSKCNNLLSALSRIQTAEQHPAYTNPAHAQHAYYQTLHTNEVNSFNAAIVGMGWITNYATDWDFVSKRVEVTTAQTNFDNNIRNLQQELRLSEDTAHNENRLPTSNISVPGSLWLFDSNDTKVDKSRLTNHVNTQIEIDHIDERLDMLNLLEWQIGTLRARYQDNLNRLKRILALQQLQQRINSTHPLEMDRRHREFNTIREISHNNLLLWPWAPGIYEPYLPNTAISVWERWVWWNPAREIHLDFVHWALWTWFNGWARNSVYSLCDEDWNPLSNNWWRLEIQQWWETLNIRWITFDNTAQTMRIDNLEITPIEWLTFPLSLDLNVRVRIHDDDTWLNIDHHKPIHIEINRPTLATADRETAYDSLVPPMNDRIMAEYDDRYRENLENEAIWRILREWWNEAEVNEIYNNETRGNMLIDRIRERLRWHFPFLAIGHLQTWFRTDMTRNNRDVPVQYLLNQNAFQNYVRQSIPDNLRNFASWQINNNANAYRDDILQEFINFQTDVINSPKDNLDNLRFLAQVPDDNDWPQSHPDSRWQRLIGRNSRKNNYTKFFQWRSANLENQILETEDWEIGYWVKVECIWVNRITATIIIDWREEPEIIEAANHDRLITWILNRANTKDWEPLNRKLRCNIALSVLKAMVMMSPQRLNREIPLTNFVDARGNVVPCDRIEANICRWNLRIRGWNVNLANRTRQNVIIFDENQFKNLHDIDMLEDWVRELSTQINSIMNATAEEYQGAVDSVRGNAWLLDYDTKQWLTGWPIKRLWWRLAYGKTNTNFDFDTSVHEAWKNVNIEFHGWKFTVTWEFDGQEYKYEAKDLWSILRKKINRKRVFDGIELAMVAAINEQYIERLRTNNLVQTENFAVSDFNVDKTWKVYIFDEDGNLSYLEIEDRALNPLWARNAGRIDPNAIPAERIRCNEQERREFMQNPLLAWRLQREMRRRLALF